MFLSMELDEMLDFDLRDKVVAALEAHRESLLKRRSDRLAKQWQSRPEYVPPLVDRLGRAHSPFDGYTWEWYDVDYDGHVVATHTGEFLKGEFLPGTAVVGAAGRGKPPSQHRAVIKDVQLELAQDIIASLGDVMRITMGRQYSKQGFLRVYLYLPSKVSTKVVELIQEKVTQSQSNGARYV